MTSTHFFWSYLPFWLWVYGLAVVSWTCVGRFLLSYLVSPGSTNYIWRWFCRLTNWALWLFGWITPRFISPRFMPLVVAYWAFVIRYMSYGVLTAAGLTPAIEMAPQ